MNNELTLIKQVIDLAVLKGLFQNTETVMAVHDAFTKITKELMQPVSIQD